MEGLANTLDDVIGQAFKDWSTPLSYSSTMRGSGGEEAHNSSSSAEHNASWTDFQVPDKEWEAVPVTSRRRRATTKRTMSPFLSRLGNTSGDESAIMTTLSANVH